jgi:hypothetical protein
MGTPSWRVALGALLALASGAAWAGGNITASVGLRMMDEDVWAPVEDQGVIGFLADLSFGPSPVHLAAGVQVSSSEEEDDPSGIEFAGSTVEWSIGLKFMPQTGLVRPFVGGGAVTTRAEFEGEQGGTTISDDDSGSGWYAEAGLLFRFAGHFDAGFNVRHVGGTDVMLFNTPGDADGTVVTALFGYGWGGERERRRRGPRRESDDGEFGGDADGQKEKTPAPGRGFPLPGF